jgi:flavin-dependent dehydrogenase
LPQRAPELRVDRIETDVCVIGGGPSGAATARSLCALGYRTCVVERRPSDGDAVVECVAPSIGPALEALGVRRAIEDAGFPVCRTKRVRWFGVEEISSQVALLVDRARFDALLLDAAAAAGAIVLRPARARRPRRENACWRVDADTPGGTVGIEARFLVDASGRRAAGRETGPPTVALLGRWRTDARQSPTAMHIEAGPDRWYWGASLPDRSTAAVVFLDRERCAGMNAADRRRLYVGLLAESALLGYCVQGQALGGLLVRDATPRHSDDPATFDFIAVGDRSAACDPLSSQGLQSAIRSGMQAATIIHTILAGGDADAAIAFHRDACLRAALRQGRIAQELYRSQAPNESAFWTRRASADAPHPATRDPAFADVDSATPLHRLRLATDASLRDTPVIDGAWIRRQPALVHPALDEPVAWLGGIALGAALADVDGKRSGSQLVDGWSRRMAPQDAQELLAWLLSRGILVDA